MKAWTSATISGQCSYDKTHVWKAGDRIFRLQGKGWTKAYCANCAKQHHEAPEDTGELLTTEDAANYPSPLKALADRVNEEIADRFDAKLAQAGKDED